MQSEGNPVAAGGLPWTERETRDLILIWGEKVLQKAFGASRRGKAVGDGFQKITEQMVLRGHSRSALECWTKIGALRVAYRRVFASNALRCFGPPLTCPFYSQLDRILQGDGITKPLRVVNSIRLQVVPQRPAPRPINTNEARGSNSAASAPLEGSETVTANPEEANKTVTEELLESTVFPNRRESQNAPTPPARTEQEVVDGDMGVAQLSPTSCIADARTKRRCVSGPDSRAKHKVAQPSKQHEEKLGGRGKGRKEEPEAHKKGGKEAGRTLRSRSTPMKKK